MRELNEARLAELELIRKRNGGLLLPKQVVDYARDESTALHSVFQWDDSVAAEQYRIWQARQVIRVMVNVVKASDGDHVIRPFVSLIGDRQKGGYRATVEVLGDDTLRDELLAQALSELQAIRRKYQELTKLAKVFAAIDEVTKSVTAQATGLAAVRQG